MIKELSFLKNNNNIDYIIDIPAGISKGSELIGSTLDDYLNYHLCIEHHMIYTNILLFDTYHLNSFRRYDLPIQYVNMKEEEIYKYKKTFSFLSHSVNKGDLFAHVTDLIVSYLCTKCK